MGQRRRIGILTGGGDCPGLNAVIRGVVKTSLHLGYEVLGFLRGFEGLADPAEYKLLTNENTSGILIQGGTILGSTNKGRFNATRGEDQRVHLAPDLIDSVRSSFEKLDLDGLICVGGDGSLTIAQRLFEAGLPIVGVPKTIDNDLSCTDFSFGFFSAVACATDALDRLHSTAASHERTMVLEVMGRHAGWIALYAGIAGGADVILIPEIDWKLENVSAKILHRREMGKKFTLIVVAEGAKLPGGKLVKQESESDLKQARLGGIGSIITEELQSHMQIETRCVVLGHLQRGGGPTTFDRALATQYGTHAVRLIEEGKFGEMVCYDAPEICSVPILQAIGKLGRVDPKSSIVIAAKAMGVSFGDTPGYSNPFIDSRISDSPAASKYNVPLAMLPKFDYDDDDM
jgi:phosphofructokinase-like protein